MVLDEPSGAGTPAEFLIGDEREDDVAARAPTSGQEISERRQRHCRHVFHVDSASAPHVTITDLSRIRRDGPGVRVRRDDVEMDVDKECRGAGVRPFDPGDDVGAPWVALKQLRRQRHVRELGRDAFGDVAFEPAPGGGVVANEL